MANNSKANKKWKEVDPAIQSGWNVIRLDGQFFKSLRVPNLDSCNLEIYCEQTRKAVMDCNKRFKFISFTYSIDDEIYFLVNSNNLSSKNRRSSKTMCLILSYFTARINYYMSQVEICSRKTIKFNELTYDARIIKLKKNELFHFFKEKIYLGKLFVGNLIVGEGLSFLNMSYKKVEELALEKDIDIANDYYHLFGCCILNDEVISMSNMSFGEYVESVSSLISNL